MAKLWLSALLCLAPALGHARCVGPMMMQSCTDHNGNVYQIQRFGTTTTIHGFDPKTGKHWNRSSTLGEPGETEDFMSGSARTKTGPKSNAQAPGTAARIDPLAPKCNQFGCY